MGLHVVARSARSEAFVDSFRRRWAGRRGTDATDAEPRSVARAGGGRRRAGRGARSSFS